MSEILYNSYYKTGSAALSLADDRAIRSFNVDFPFDLQQSLRHLSERGIIVETTPLRRSLYYNNRRSELTAFVSCDGDTMFFNNKLAKIFACCGHVWAVFYRPNGKKLR